MNNYFYDEPFRNYVNITFGQIYPLMVITIGLSGGLGLGYLLLKRKVERRPSLLRLSSIEKMVKPGTPSNTSQTTTPEQGKTAA